MAQSGTKETERFIVKVLIADTLARFSSADSVIRLDVLRAQE